MQLMKQECPLALVYATAALYVVGAVFFLRRGDYLAAALWLVGVPLAQWAYIRAFPAISRFVGYGRVDDRPAETRGPAPVKVTLYTAVACPFCPIVRQRLEALQAEMDFELEEVDVTLNPGRLMAKGVRAVPVVEAGDRLIVGHATSQQLAALIQGEE